MQVNLFGVIFVWTRPGIAYEHVQIKVKIQNISP